jgi:hypothetical protein
MRQLPFLHVGLLLLAPEKEILSEIPRRISKLSELLRFLFFVDHIPLSFHQPE